MAGFFWISKIVYAVELVKGGGDDDDEDEDDDEDAQVIYDWEGETNNRRYITEGENSVQHLP